MTSVITLDNYHEKLTPWNPDGENQLYAVVDMGSNGIRFSITSLASPRARLLSPIYSERAGVSLFDALTQSTAGLVFPENTITEVAQALGRFKDLATAHGVPSDHFIILATEAMRRAANTSEILKAIAESTNGLNVNILDPPVETLVGAVMGSRSSLGEVPRGALFLDLGGGSVQMTWVDTSSPKYEIDAAKAGRSLPYGAAKLSRILEEHPEDIRIMEINTLRNGLKHLYDELCIKFPALQSVKSAYDKGERSVLDVYLCGGGFRGYGSMLMHDDPIQPYPMASSNTYAVSASRFKQTARMMHINQTYQGKILGMSKRRRRQFAAVITVVEAFIAAVPNIGVVTFCGGSNRQGALMMKLPRHIRESNPLDVLANIEPSELPIFHAILQKLSTALPDDTDFTNIPTVFSTGSGLLFVRRAFNRSECDSDANTSFALHDCVSRDMDCPGLTHLVRAILGLGIAARWGGSMSPVDTQIYQGLRGILQSRSEHAVFWTQYVGALAGLIATMFPVLPKSRDAIERAIWFESHLEKAEKKRQTVVLAIRLASELVKGLNLDDLASDINGAVKDDDAKHKGVKPPFKILTKITTFES